MKHFYSHLIQFEELFIELDDLNLSQDEKHHLGKLIDSNLHHTVMDAVLSELKEEDKETFLRLVSSDKHDKIWEHLIARVELIEEKIKKAADEIKKQLHEDIKEVKRGK
jgi:hypothetical protein